MAGTFEQTLEAIKAGSQKQNSDAAADAIRQQAMQEWNQENPEKAIATDKVEEPVKVEEPTKPGSEPEKPEVKPEEKTEEKPETDEKKEAPKALSDDEVLTVQEDTLSEEDKLRRTTILNQKEEAKKEEIRLYAKAEKISEEEAAQAIEAENKLAEQYHKDPKKLARTARYWQSQHSRLEAKVKAEQEAQERQVGVNDIIINGKKMGYEQAKPLMIEAYRNEFGDKVADKSDDEVFDEAKKDWQTKVKAFYDQQAVKVSQDAQSKRAKIIIDLPEHAKAFRHEIENSLNLLPDSVVVRDDYSPEDIISWARGKHYSPDKIKELETAAFNRGQENAKILGEKVKPSPSAPSNQKPVETSPDKEVELLTAEQKNQALNMFDSVKSHVWDEQRKYKEYIALMKEQGKWTVKKENA
jgi:hypothetical protein